MKTEHEKEICRCPWVDLSKPDYVEYHDKEWGVPVYDDRLIFEFLSLEAAQAGLSWYTVLKKRANYRIAFENFEPEKVAKFNEAKIECLLQNPGIIRNRLKIESTVNNAHRFLEVQATFGSFSQYIWGFVGGKPKINTIRKLSDYQATSPESDAMSKDLKKRGFYPFYKPIRYVNGIGLSSSRTLVIDIRVIRPSFVIMVSFPHPAQIQTSVS